MLFHHVPLTTTEMDAEMIDGKRYYLTPSGGKYPSITTVIGSNPEKKAGIAKWRRNVGEEKANRISTRAASRGTDFHLMCEDWLNNAYDEEKFKGKHLPLVMFKNTKTTLSRINNIYAQEVALYSDHLEIAGRVDCIAEFDGELSIIDFKTSAKEKKLKWIEDYSNIEVIAIGIGHDVTRYYKKAVKIADVQELGDVMINQLTKLFSEKIKSSTH